MKGNNWSVFTIAAALAFAWSLACAPTPQQNDLPRRGAAGEVEQTEDRNADGGSRDRGPTREENRSAAERFFNDRILPSWRNTAIPRCMDCHDAPRNTIGNPDAGGLTIYDFGAMYALLKDGPAANDNELIHILIGNRGHPGPRICRTEQDAQCAMAIEWWNAAFTESGGGGAFSLGRVQTVSPRGQVSGYAVDPDDNDAVFQVRVYIDGDKDEGTFLSEVTANQTTQINGLQRPRGFSFKIPDEMINNDERVVHVYAMKDDEEVELADSPYQFIAYAPKGLGVVGNAFPQNATNCGGCHNFTYETLYGALLSPAPRDGGTRFNNELWRRMSTSEQGGVSPLPHTNFNGRGALPNQIAQWWDAEFN